MTPFLADADCTLYHGDCLDVLRDLPDASVHMCATSPPFWSLRDYGSDGQIGLEATVDEWVARLCDVFDEVRRVLRDDGTCWIEVGDSFGDKQLVGQPWRLAFALQARGWFLRSEIIWSRLGPNPMPESVTDRPTKAHSTIFLLSKKPRYHFDADAIREKYAPGSVEHHNKYHAKGSGNAYHNKPNLAVGGNLGLRGNANEANPAGANARSVWQIATEPTPFQHFATWPRKLVARMILAGTSERGCCPECGAPWVRETEREVTNPGNRQNNGRYDGSIAERRGFEARREVAVTTLGWSPSCGCEERAAAATAGSPGAGDASFLPVPCTVLDPFAGSGTTLLVARQHGRRSVGIELNESYCQLAAGRLAQQSLLTEASA